MRDDDEGVAGRAVGVKEEALHLHGGRHGGVRMVRTRRNNDQGWNARRGQDPAFSFSARACVHNII